MDGTKEGQDPSQTGDPSVELKGTPTEPQTFTKESEEKAVSDALSVAGRDAKTITEKTTEAQRILESAQNTRKEIKEERERWQNERDEADREVLKADPEALKSLDERIRQRNEATKLASKGKELDERELKNTEAQKEVAQSTKERNAREIATRLNVDSEPLLKFTDGSKEAMEELAQKLPKNETKPPLKTDPGVPIGGGQMPESAKDKMRSGWGEIHK